MTVAIKPLYERGHLCQVCGRQTIHRYLGPQRDENGEILFHLWNCGEFGATVRLDSPEEFAERCFRIQTRRMRRRRGARTYG